MSGLFRTDLETGFVHADADELDRKLREGDGLLWSGDPRLYLGMGILTAPQSRWEEKLGRRVQKGDIVARRYEVWRHTEDGEDVLIGHWQLSEFDRILVDLAPMRLDSPGHVDALDEIDKHNAKLEKAAGDAFVANGVEAMAHALDVWHDTENPKHTFRGMPGSRDDTTSVTPQPGDTAPLVVNDKRASAELS